MFLFIMLISKNKIILEILQKKEHASNTISLKEPLSMFLKMYFLEFGQQHIEFVAIVYIEHLTESVDPKMLKKLFRFLCLAFAITNLCASDIITDFCEFCKGNHISFNFPKPIEQVSKFAQIEHLDELIAPNYSFINTSNFYRGLLSRVSDDYFCYCENEIEKQLIFILLYLPGMKSVTFITDENTDSYLFITVAIGELSFYKLNWHMHRNCLNVVEFILDIEDLRILILDVYSSVDLNECEYFGFNGMTQLTTLHINLNKPSYSDSANLTNYALDATFLRDMKNLTELKLNCASDEFEVHLPKEIFLGLHSLSTISLEECKFNNITAEHFEHLTSLRVLKLSYVQFDNFDWLRYKCCICFLNYVCKFNIQK